ncbi:MAG: NAD(P)H-hydrate dehydratase [candidate division WOR-3 bacterium]
MHAILSPEEMRAMDDFTIKNLGVPDAVLMESAGRGCFSALAEAFGDLYGASVVVVAGKGNNGGDGFVIARYAHFAGARVRVFLLGKRSELKGSPKIYAGVLEKLGIEIEEISARSKAVAAALAGADVVVDAIFGTGFSGRAEGLYAWAIEAINETGGFVLSVDIPSGVDGATGMVLGPAVVADITATMAYPKLGHILYPGRLFAGEIFVVDIGIPPELEPSAKRWVPEHDDVSEIIPVRLGPENKSSFGRLGIVAGSWQYSGAAILAGLGALRAGVGIAYLCVPESLKPHLIGRVAEAILVGMPEKEGHLAPGGTRILKELRPDALVLGPGLGRTAETKNAIREIIAEIDVPAIVDADGLWAIAEVLDSIMKKRRSPLVLTPHPGEMALFTGGNPSEIDQNRLSVAEDFVKERKNLVLVLKGAPTIIATHDITYLNPTGNPGMATGGSGDVLSGMIGSLLAQGASAEDAAIAGVYLHGLAGDLASSSLSEASALPSDVVDYIPYAMKEVLGRYEHSDRNSGD